MAGFLRDAGANITASDQFSTDPVGGRFLLRTEFVHEDASRDALGRAFAREVATPYAMHWRLTDAAHRGRIAVLASRPDHCLLDLLWRARAGQLAAEIALVVSNHADRRSDAEAFGVEFAHVPVDPARGGKPAAEARMLELLADRFELVVLARYMQVLSGDFLARLGAPVINIHHSFLPAFAGADPYRRAKERGVKMVGATAHYVTEELDAGPIIDQDVRRVDHRMSVAELERAGQDVERNVLARAVSLHLDDRVLVDGTTTVVF